MTPPRVVERLDVLEDRQPRVVTARVAVPLDPFTFRIGGQTVEAGPGDYVWLPRGIEHGFELKTEQAKALITITPAGLEGFFKQLSEPAQSPTLPPPPEGPPDLERMMALFEEYGVKLSPPPPPL